MEEDEVKSLKEQYDKMNTDESWDYTEEILLKMGIEIQKRFPGVDFILKARFKSEKSHNGKIERIIKKGENKKIYDDIGFCLIVKSVDDDFGFEHALCEMSVEDRIKAGLEIDDEKSSIKIINKTYKKSEEEEEKNEITENIEKLKKKIIEQEQQENPDEELIKLLKESLKNMENQNKANEDLLKKINKKSDKIIKIGNSYYKAVDNKINEMIATHIMNKLIEDKEFMDSLELEVIPGRKKFHDGGKSGYYRAYHNAVRSKKINDWNLEVQALSYQNYVTSREGKARHSKCEGKSRKFPRLGETDEQKAQFTKEILKTAPKNLVYQPGIYDGEQVIKPGKVYRCSDVENMAYFYMEVLKDKPDLFRYVTGNQELFSDEGEIIECSEVSGSNMEKRKLSSDCEER